MIILIEIDYYNRISGTKETLCLTTGSHYSKDGKMFLPNLAVGLEFEEFLFSKGSSGGDSSSSIGNIVIPNSDGQFDYLDYAAFDGRQFRTYWAESESSVEVFHYVTGTVKRHEMGLKEVVLTISDVLETMDAQMQLGTFAGTNGGMGAAGGLEGGEGDIKGQIKPRLYGRCRNIEPYLINSFHLIYACNYDRDGNRMPVYGFWNVFGKGVDYLYEGDVATAELLITATVSEGYYKTCVAEGCFRLGTVPGGAVTCDVFEMSGEDCSAARVIGRLLEDYPVPSMDLTSLERLHTDFKCPIGIYITSERTVLEVLREILESLDCYLVPDAEGVARFGRVQLSLDQPKFKLTREHIRDLDRVPTSDSSSGIPAYSVKILHTKNWKTLDKGSLALSVDPLLQEFLATEYRIAEHTDTALLTTNPGSKPIEYETLLQEPVPVKLRNGSFKSGFTVVEPTDWVDVYFGTIDLIVLYPSQGKATIPAGTGSAYLKQILTTPDEIFPGEYVVTFTVLSGTATLIVKDVGLTLFTVAVGVGTSSHTFTATGEVEIWIGCVLGTTEITGVSVKESDAFGTPQTEAARRFALRSVPEERYTFKVSHEFCKDISLGDEITLEYNRFGMDEGKNFLVIGRSMELPSIDVELDVWRSRNDS